MRRLVLAASLFAGALAPVEAHAQDATEQAARTFRAGADAYAHGDFATAARDFEAAFRLAPRGAAAYNAGLAWEGAGELARAADDYATALGTSDFRPEQRGDATSRLKALEAKLARVVVTGPPDAHVSVDGAPDASLPLGIHLAPGRHALRASFASGRSETRSFEANAGEEVGVRLNEAPEAATATNPAPSSTPAPPAPPPPTAARAPERDAEPTAPPPKPARPETPADDSGASTRRALAWVSLGGAVVASGAAVLFYEDGLSARDRFLNNGSTDQSLHDQAITLRTLSQVSWGVAGALGVTAVVLYLTSSAPSSTGGAALHVGPRGVDLRVRF
jgi:hypothetical protein